MTYNFCIFYTNFILHQFYFTPKLLLFKQKIVLLFLHKKSYFCLYQLFPPNFKIWKTIFEKNWCKKAQKCCERLVIYDAKMPFHIRINFVQDEGIFQMVARAHCLMVIYSNHNDGPVTIL